jgi:DNA polymerase
MDDQPLPTRDRLLVALQQKLESLQRSGVEAIPKARAAPPLNPPSAAPERAAPGRHDRPPVAAAPPRPAAPPAPVAAPPVTWPLPANESAAAPAAGATDERSAALTLIRREVQTCTRCAALVASRTQTVFGVGNVRTRVCLLGEAPGADEDRQGEPFVGRAGQLLDKMIEACTLKRTDVYILNVLKCRPPNNRTPLPDEVASCRGFFERQLEIIRPEFICCLGATAAQTLLQTTQSLSRLRGRLHEYRGIKVVVTYHPAYLLRYPENKRAAWDDLQLLMQQMGLQVPSKKTGGGPSATTTQDA